MDEIKVVAQRAETPREAKVREWFEQQETKAADNLDAAATHLITLITGQLTVLLGILALADDPLPDYLTSGFVRWAGSLTILALLVALWLALWVVLPYRQQVNRYKPTEQINVLEQILFRKEQRLYGAILAFAVGLAGLGGVLIYALLAAARL